MKIISYKRKAQRLTTTDRERQRERNRERQRKRGEERESKRVETEGDFSHVYFGL
jgi:hypothetical protein